MDSYTYFLFGEKAVQSYADKEDVKQIIDDDLDHEIYVFNNEADPTGESLLNAYEGNKDWFKITEEHYNILEKNSMKK